MTEYQAFQTCVCKKRRLYICDETYMCAYCKTMFYPDVIEPLSQNLIRGLLITEYELTTDQQIRDEIMPILLGDSHD